MLRVLLLLGFWCVYDCGALVAQPLYPAETSSGSADSTYPFMDLSSPDTGELEVFPKVAFVAVQPAFFVPVLACCGGAVGVPGLLQRPLLGRLKIAVMVLASGLAYATYRSEELASSILRSAGSSGDIFRDSEPESYRYSGESSPPDTPEPEGENVPVPFVEKLTEEEENFFNVLSFSDSDRGSDAWKVVDQPRIRRDLRQSFERLEGLAGGLLESYMLQIVRTEGEGMRASMEVRRDQLYVLVDALRMNMDEVKAKLEDRDFRLTSDGLNSLLLIPNLVVKNLMIALMDTQQNYLILGQEHLILGLGMYPKNAFSYNVEYQHYHAVEYVRMLFSNAFSRANVDENGGEDLYFSPAEKVLFWLRQIDAEVEKLESIKTFEDYKKVGKAPPYYQHFIEVYISEIKGFKDDIIKDVESLIKNNKHSSVFKLTFAESVYKGFQQAVAIALNMSGIITETQTIINADMEALSDGDGTPRSGKIK